MEDLESSGTQDRTLQVSTEPGGGEGCMGWEGQEMGHFRGMPPLSGNLKIPRNSQAFLLKAHYAGLLS